MVWSRDIPIFRQIKYGKCPKISNALFHTRHTGLNFAFYAVVT